MDTVDIIMTLESGEATNKQVLEGISSLVKEGVIGSLQGAYGRMFNNLVNEGFLDPNGDITEKGKALIEHEAEPQGDQDEGLN